MCTFARRTLFAGGQQMQPTILIFSSHDRCNYIHNEWIAQRALAGNKRILFLPMSEGEVDGDEYRRQIYSWDKFSWFFSFYKQYGLVYYPFYWNRNLRRQDIDKLLDGLASDDVVILGGGNPFTGMHRYKTIGKWFFNDENVFPNLLWERHNKGLLTVGFSAGVDQLCQYINSSIDSDVPDPNGFGICRNVVASSHYSHEREESLRALAAKYPHCLVFGLPNDSGIAVNQGILPSGNFWQVFHMIIDKSWHYPADQFHIKTRQGMKIQHFYMDGRHWAFNGGDILVRIQSPDTTYAESFIITPGQPIREYWKQEYTNYSDIGEILADH